MMRCLLVAIIIIVVVQKVIARFKGESKLFMSLEKKWIAWYYYDNMYKVEHKFIFICKYYIIVMYIL